MELLFTPKFSRREDDAAYRTPRTHRNNHHATRWEGVLEKR
jgi:hypothetical protein